MRTKELLQSIAIRWGVTMENPSLHRVAGKRETQSMKKNQGGFPEQLGRGREASRKSTVFALKTKRKIE